MVSSVSPIVANLYIEHLKDSPQNCHYLPDFGWDVDDTFEIQQEEHKQNLLEHINKVDPAMKFTVETTNNMGQYHS